MADGFQVCIVRVVEKFLLDEGRCMPALDENSRKLIHELKYHGARGCDQRFSCMDRTSWFSVFLEDSVDPGHLPFEKIEVKRLQQSLWIAEAMLKELGAKRIVHLLEAYQKHSHANKTDQPRKEM